MLYGRLLWTANMDPNGHCGRLCEPENGEMGLRNYVKNYTIHCAQPYVTWHPYQGHVYLVGREVLGPNFAHYLA